MIFLDSRIFPPATLTVLQETQFNFVPDVF